MSKVKLDFSMALEDGSPEVIVVDSNDVNVSEGPDYEYEGYAESINAAQESIIALASISEVIKNSDNVSLEALSLAELALEQHLKNTQSLGLVKISTENLNLSDRKTVVLESIGSAIKAIWDKIVATFKFIINRILEFFGKLISGNELKKARKSYDSIKEDSKNKDITSKKPVNVNSYISFLKCETENKVLEANEMKKIIEEYSHSIQKLKDIMQSIADDVISTNKSLYEEVRAYHTEPNVTSLGSRASVVFSKLISKSEYIRFMDGFNDGANHNLKAAIAKELDIDVNNIKVVYDSNSSKLLIAEKVKVEGDYVKSVHQYKFRYFDIDTRFKYLQMKDLSIDDIIIMYSFVVDGMELSVKSIDAFKNYLNSIDSRIDNLSKLIGENIHLEHSVKDFIIPFMRNFNTATAALANGVVDINKRFYSIRVILDKAYDQIK